jgi:hypothetical protein
MSGSLTQTWGFLGVELWNPLGTYAVRDFEAPDSLFSDLYLIADEFLSPRPTTVDLEEARSNPELARQRFLSLQGTDFASESTIVTFLEAVYSLIDGYDIFGFGDYYKRLIQDLLTKFNLRYRVEIPFGLRFLLPGSFTNLYAELRRLNANNQTMSLLFDDFEKSFDRYVRSGDDTDLRTCIAKASNYAEGLASATAGNPTSGNTLGTLASKLKDWPHDKIRQTLIDLYSFCSDYPGIRHGGTPSNVIRVLEIRDLMFASVVLMSFSEYLTPHIDQRVVLGI